MLPDKVVEFSLKKRNLALLTAVNVFGTLFGFYYYLPQFNNISPWLWIFVADSPLATLFIALSFLMQYLNRENHFVDVLAFVGNVKYGLWTVFVLLFYFQTFWTGNSTPMYLFLLFSHLGMFLQAFLVTEYSGFNLKHVLIGISWFLLNDLLDYGLDIHTSIYASHSHPVSGIMIVAISLTLIGATLAYLYQDF